MSKIIVEIPEELKCMKQPLEQLVLEAKKQVERGRRGQRVAYEEFEGRLAERVATVERSAHEATLASLDVDAEEIRIDGERYRRVGRSKAAYMTQAGSAAVERSLYRKVGCRNAKVVNTVTLRAQALEDVWLPGTARAMAHLLQQGTSREAEVTAQRLGRLPYCRSSFERMGHEVGELYVSRHEEIEEVLIQAAEVPAEASSISVSLDRVSLPMEEPRRRPVGRPRKNAPKRPVARVYRMSYCGTVTIHDSEGKALETIRYGTMPEGDPETLCMGMAGDVVALRTKRPELTVTLLCDGAPEMWNLLNAEFAADEFGAVRQLIDFYHLIEKLAPAAKVLHGAAEGARVLRQWKLALLNRSTAALDILTELEDSGREHARVGNSKPVHEAITYLENNHERMNYAAARRRGLPIASGNVEATCKTLVGLRMKRCGARWKTRTGEHIIHLRALALSDRWEQAMDLTLRRPQVKIRAA